jgi:RNA ligase
MTTKTKSMPAKPIGRKNYGSIGHLPCSRMGPADHACHEGQQRIATEKSRDRHDVIIVMEKVDGSNVGIARVGDEIHALGRAGYLAQSSKYEQHQLFAAWVRESEEFWRDMLQPGERLVGEWLAQAHSTLYTLPQGPFAAFDLMVGEKRRPFAELAKLCENFAVPMPKLLHLGGPLPVDRAMELHGPGAHGCDEPEGAVWRVERKGTFDFMAKWVRPDKIDGKYLPDVAASLSDAPVWNWRPAKCLVSKGD